MALRQIQNDYKTLMKDPVEGFCVVPDESNFFVWKIYIEGPHETPFVGGIFELQMRFPDTYPMMPPELKFISEFWHPNVYANGNVCISILHPPGHDIMSGELPEERWMPTQTVSTIILSVLSILGDPNISSPANIDASVQWRDSRDAFCKRAKALVAKSNLRIPNNIKIPHPESNPEEKALAIQKRKQEALGDAFDYDDVGDLDEYGLCGDFDDFDVGDEFYDIENVDTEKIPDSEPNDDVKDKKEKKSIKKKKEPIPVTPESNKSKNPKDAIKKQKKKERSTKEKPLTDKATKKSKKVKSSKSKPKSDTK